MRTMIFFLIILFALLPVNAAHIARYQKKQCRGKIPHIVIEKEPVLFCTQISDPKDRKIFLPPEVYNKIFRFMTIDIGEPLLKDAAKRINVLGQVDKYLNMRINDDKRTLQLIKKFSSKYGVCNLKVAQVLCTQEANRRYTLQSSFYLCTWLIPKCLPITLQEHADKLKSSGLDVNFSYNAEYASPLVQCLSYNGCSLQAEWFVENGANINVCDKEGKSCLMLALAKSLSIDCVSSFLDRSSLVVNHQDNDKNTVLHYCVTCILSRPAEYQTKFCDLVIKKLFAKGANPNLKNKDGLTPLDVAKSANAPAELISLLEDAMVNFKDK